MGGGYREGVGVGGGVGSGGWMRVGIMGYGCRVRRGGVRGF